MFDHEARRARAGVMLLAALAALPWVCARGRTVDPMTAFSAPPRQSDFSLAPNGRILAWRQVGGAKVEVLIYDLTSRTVLRTLTMDPSMTVNGLQWEGNGTVLIDAAATEHNGDGRPFAVERFLAVDVASGKSRMLLMHGSAMAMVSGARLLMWDIPGKAHTVVMSTDEFSAGRFSSGLSTRIDSARGNSGWALTLFAVDTRTGEGTPIASGDAFTYQWVVDRNGDPVARAEWRGRERRYFILVRHGDAWRQIYRRTDGVRPRLWGLDGSGKAILATIVGHGRQALWSIPLDGSPPKEVLPGSNVLSVGFTAYTHKPSAVRVAGPGAHLIWRDPAARLRYESVAHAFPGREIRITGYSRDGRRVLAEVQGPASPPMDYLIDFATHRADIAGEAYPQLDHVALGKVTVIRYRTRGGHTIVANLTLPPGHATGRLPLIVLAPGGIERGDPMAFDWLAQFLAVRGYAVLQPEIPRHGVYGLGQIDGGMITWGGASQHYATDGVKFLIGRGVVDPRQVCIVGMGYGGYAALAGVAFSPRVYACAVSIDGISDLPAYLAHEKDEFGGLRSDHAVLAYWNSEVGSPFDRRVIAESPVNAAKQVAAPVLLLYTAKDIDVPAAQMEEMDRALRKLGKPVTFVRLGADSSIARPATRRTVLTDIDAFLGGNLD